jgi:hypothetical protein
MSRAVWLESDRLVTLSSDVRVNCWCPLIYYRPVTSRRVSVVEYLYKFATSLARPQIIADAGKAFSSHVKRQETYDEAPFVAKKHARAIEKCSALVSIATSSAIIFLYCQLRLVQPPAIYTKCLLSEILPAPHRGRLPASPPRLSARSRFSATPPLSSQHGQHLFPDSQLPSTSRRGDKRVEVVRLVGDEELASTNM